MVRYFAKKTKYEYLRTIILNREEYIGNFFDMVKETLKNYLVDEAYIVRLELPDGINSKELADSMYSKDSPEFKELMDCGVQPTIGQDGHKVIEAGYRLAQFNPNQWLMNVKDLEAIEWTPFKSI